MTTKITVESLVKAMGFVLPGEVETFENHEYAKAREWIARLGDWRRGLKGAANPQTADAAVVVWVNNHDDVATWRKFAQTTDIVIARPGTSQERAGFRLAESIAAADVVVATGLPFMLEAVSRVKPTIAMMGAGGTDAADLEAFVNKYPSMRDRVTVTETAVGGAAQIVIALSKRPSAHTNRGNAAAVQKRVDDKGSERVYRRLV